MADTAEKALPTAATLACPEWCTKDVTNDDDSIVHLRLYPEDRSGHIVVLGQSDTPVLYADDEPAWLREDAAITVVSRSVHEFDIHGLDPRQAYALAALIAECGNEHLAESLLDAVGLVKPELVR